MAKLAALSTLSLHIQGASGLLDTVEAFAPTLIISIANPEERHDPLAGITETPIVRLRFHDGAPMHTGAVWASYDHIDAVAQALDAHPHDRDVRLLVHCGAGERRSPAVAAFALAHLLVADRPIGLTADEAQEVAARVFAAAPDASPDRRLLSIITEHLEDFDFSLVEAIQAQIRRRDAPISAPKKAQKQAGKRARKAFRI